MQQTFTNNQYTNQQIHLMKYNEWPLSDSCMLQHPDVILGEPSKTKEHK